MTAPDLRHASGLPALDPDTEAFLARLRREDVVLLQTGIDLVRSALTVGRFSKWLFITLAGAFLGAVTLGEGAVKVMAWIKGTMR